MFPTQHYIAALLERGVRVLIYAGANDWVCNWVRHISLLLDRYRSSDRIVRVHIIMPYLRCGGPVVGADLASRCA